MRALHGRLRREEATARRSVLALPVLLLVVVTAVSGCGGVGVEAPRVLAPDEDPTGTCPSAEEALKDTNAALDDGRLAALAPIAREILIDDGGLRVALPVMRQTSERLPPGDLLAIADGYAEGEGIARLVPHLVNILQYMDGTSPYLAGEHYAPLEAMHRVLTRCDPTETLGAVRRLLDLQVTLPDGTTTAWIHVMFDALVAVAEEPEFVALLERIEFTEAGEGEGEDIALGRDAFVLVTRLIIGNVASPNFDLAYVRGVLDDVLVTQLEVGGDARAKLTALLDLMELVLDPEADIFEHVQVLMQCANRHDEDGAVPGMLFDYLSTEELDFIVFLEDLDGLGSDPAGEALRLSLIEMSAVLEEHPQLTRDLTAVLARFLEPEVARVVVPAVLGLKGTGVLSELLAVVSNLLDGPCR